MEEAAPHYKVLNRKGRGNYRPLSLFPVAQSVMECCVQDVVSRHLVRNKLLSQNQRGFLSDKSCLETYN